MWEWLKSPHENGEELGMGLWHWVYRIRKLETWTYNMYNHIYLYIFILIASFLGWLKWQLPVLAIPRKIEQVWRGEVYRHILLWDSCFPYGKECTCIQWFWWIAGSRRNNPGFWSLVEVTHEGWLAAAKVSNQTSSTESTGQPRQSNTVGAIFDCSNHFNREKPALEQMLFNKMSELETRVKILLKSNKWASITKQSLRVVVLAWCRKCPTEGKGKLAAWIDSDR